VAENHQLCSITAELLLFILLWACKALPKHESDDYSEELIRGN
jgi:hypothetical protein